MNLHDLVVKKAYEAGAKRVDVNYTDEVNARAFYDLAPDEAFHEFPKWAAMQRDELIENKGALLWIDADNPDLLEGVSIDRISNFQKASGKALENYRKAVMNDVITWSIVAMPSEKWAAKVFPDLEAERTNASTLGANFPSCANWGRHSSSKMERAY